MSRIAVFGGTFNPPHLAHKRLICEMNSKVGFDKILIVPTFVPPHKTSPFLAKSEDRLEMCRRTFFEECFDVSDIEIVRGGKSYTYDTLCQMKRQYGENEWFLIVGSDMLLSFDKWYRYEDILKMCTLCVASRENSVDTEKLALFSKEKLSLNEENGEIIILSAKPFELSSTEIRSLIKEQKDASPYVEEKTLEYIQEKGLYL